MPTARDPLALTQSWVDRVVIGLNLCPFARAVQVRGQIRYRLSAAHTEELLLADLADELAFLKAADPVAIDTSLLVHPRVLQNFLDYNDFLARADTLLVDLGLEGELQIASFHPEYCFAGSAPEDVANYTNRSPFPMLHLLREASVERAVAAFPEASRIYERNIATLRALEPHAIERLLSDSTTT